MGTISLYESNMTNLEMFFYANRELLIICLTILVAWVLIMLADLYYNNKRRK